MGYVKRRLHNGIRLRGRQVTRPSGHHYRLLSAGVSSAGHIFGCRCGERWLPDMHFGTLTRYDTFERYRV